MMVVVVAAMVVATMVVAAVVVSAVVVHAAVVELRLMAVVAVVKDTSKSVVPLSAAAMLLIGEHVIMVISYWL